MQIKPYAFFLMFLVSLLSMGCANGDLKGGYVEIAGVVVDEKSGELLDDVSVKLYVFKQGSIFTMGTHEFYKQVETSHYGKFRFTIEKGRTLQIVTQTQGARLSGGVAALGKVSENRSDIVLTHNSDRE